MMKPSMDRGPKSRSPSKALCISLSTRELEKKSKNAAKVVPIQGQSIEALPKIRKHSSTSPETWENKRLGNIITAGRIYDRRVHVISSKETKDRRRILPQDFSAIPISSSQLVRLSSEDDSVPADSDTVYALVKISITQVDYQDNSVPTDPDAEYALTKTIHDHAIPADSDSDSDPDFSLIKTATGQADFEENSVSVDPDAKYWLTTVQKGEALCTNLSLYPRNADAYYALIPPPFIKQPEARPIALAELEKEVDKIYAGILMVEAKCKELDPSAWGPNMSNDEWRAPEALYVRLLHEHYDFFLATKHPAADWTLRNLAASLSMPARMWYYGIYSFLEILRNRLPELRDQMLTFIHIAYSMLALLHETVSAFKDTWAERLGDLARYGMVVQENIRGREQWTGVARYWYNKVADNNSTVGRLYHHLAVVAPSHSLQQLSLYTRSLTCVAPYKIARGSIMRFFDFFLREQKSTSDRLPSIESVLIKAHEILSCDGPVVEFEALIHQIHDKLLDNYIESVTTNFKTQGVFMTVANFAALFEHGSADPSKSIFHLAFQETNIIEAGKIDLASLTSFEIESSRKTIRLASQLTFTTFSVILQRVDDENVFPCVHLLLLLVWNLAKIEKAITMVEKDVPWRHICSFLNTLATHEAMTSKIYADVFPGQGSDRPLPEDFVVRGQMYSLWYYPRAWFEDAQVDEEERLLELPSTAASRVERILWLGIRIASVCPTVAQYEKIALTYFSLIDGYVMTRIPQRFKWRNEIRRWQAAVFEAGSATFVLGKRLLRLC